MKKIILFSFFLLTFTAGFSFAEKSSASVNMDYLSKAKREKYVEDFSYVPRRNYNTGKQIRDMGRRLGIRPTIPFPAAILTTNTRLPVCTAAVLNLVLMLSILAAGPGWVPLRI